MLNHFNQSNAPSIQTGFSVHQLSNKPRL